MDILPQPLHCCTGLRVQKYAWTKYELVLGARVKDNYLKELNLSLLFRNCYLQRHEVHGGKRPAKIAILVFPYDAPSSQVLLFVYSKCVSSTKDKFNQSLFNIYSSFVGGTVLVVDLYPFCNLM